MSVLSITTNTLCADQHADDGDDDDDDDDDDGIGGIGEYTILYIILPELLLRTKLLKLLNLKKDRVKRHQYLPEYIYHVFEI